MFTIDENRVSDDGEARARALCRDGKARAATAKPRQQSRKGKVRKRTAMRECEPFDVTEKHKQPTAKERRQSREGDERKPTEKGERDPFAAMAKHKQRRQSRDGEAARAKNTIER
jgi:hypothetical protein